MADEQTTKKDEKSEKNEALEQQLKDTLSPEQKHKNYLEDVERLHNEP